jgi:hypothetical protein
VCGLDAPIEPGHTISARYRPWVGWHRNRIDDWCPGIGLTADIPGPSTEEREP